MSLSKPHVQILKGMGVYFSATFWPFTTLASREKEITENLSMLFSSELPFSSNGGIKHKRRVAINREKTWGENNQVP